MVGSWNHGRHLFGSSVHMTDYLLALSLNNPYDQEAQLSGSKNTPDMVRKLTGTEQAPQEYIQSRDTSWHEKFYFFYGTLMDLSTLARVLEHCGRPETYAAFITGYSMKLWGQYPALVDEDTDQRIAGRAYRVTSKKEADRLAVYETSMYRVDRCTIYFEDGSQAAGVTFIWDLDSSLLKEGTFDLKDWLMQRKEDLIMARGPPI